MAEQLTPLQKSVQEYEGCDGVPGDCLKAGLAVNERRAETGIVGPSELPEVCGNLTMNECFFHEVNSNGQHDGQITEVSFPIRGGQP